MNQHTRISAVQVKRISGQKLPGLVSLPLLIIIAVILTTIHSESSLHSSSKMFASAQSDLVQDKVNPQLISTNPTSLNQAMALKEAAGTVTREDQQIVSTDHSKNNGHAVLVGPSNQHAHNPSRMNLASNQFSHVNLDAYSQGSEPQAQIMVEDAAFGTNLESAERQLKDSAMQSAQDVDASQDAAENYDSSKDDRTGKLKDPLLERRLGLFKKGQQQSSGYGSLPYSSLGANPYYSECERCLAGTQSSSPLWPTTELPTFKQNLMQPFMNQNIPPFAHSFTPFKSKMNKFQFSKPTNFGDSYYLNQRYRMPILNRVPYRAFQPLNCVVQSPSLLGNSGTAIIGSTLSNQVPIEESKQISYANSPY